MCKCVYVVCVCSCILYMYHPIIQSSINLCVYASVQKKKKKKSTRLIIKLIWYTRNTIQYAWYMNWIFLLYKKKKKIYTKITKMLSEYVYYIFRIQIYNVCWFDISKSHTLETKLIPFYYSYMVCVVHHFTRHVYYKSVRAQTHTQPHTTAHNHTNRSIYSYAFVTQICLYIHNMHII